MVEYETFESESWILTGEGFDIAENGSHEAKVFSLIPPGEDGMTVADIQVKYPLYEM